MKLLMFSAGLLFMVLTGAPWYVTAVNAEVDENSFQEIISKYSYQRIICLDVNEQYTYFLKNGRKKIIELISVAEHRDSVLKKLRWAEVNIKIDGEKVSLICAPYVMPVEVNGLRIQADTTSGWLKMPKQVQFSLWDATDPIVKPDQLAFPIPNYLLFSHGIQNYNEVVHLGRNDGNPSGPTSYHNYGIDFAAYEAGESVLSPVDGKIVTLWPEKNNYNSVTLEDKNGLIWCLAHMDSTMPNISDGCDIKKGQLLGTVGMKGPSGRFSHLHIGTYTRSADGKVHNKDRNLRLNLYPWFVAAYKELPNHRNLLAVAGTHHSVTVGDEVRFDGSNSIAFDSKIVVYKWQFHDGKTVDKAVINRTFDQPGTFIATLFIEDDEGTRDVDFCNIKVYPRNGQIEGLPTIFMSYTPTTEVFPEQPVKFRMWIQRTDEDKTPIKIDFGDGAVINDYKSFSSIQHKFKTPGIYVITADANVNNLPVTQKQKVIVNASK